MDFNFRLSHEAAGYLCYQRTQYLVQIAEAYKNELRQIYYNIEPHLPKPGPVLDIGAGLAGIDVVLAKLWAPDAAITLLDKNCLEPGSKIGWHESVEEFSGYNEFRHALGFFKQNGADISKVHCVTPADGFPAGPFNLVMSFMSWGFHYPLATYAQQAVRALNKGGVIIVDIRKGHDDGSLGEGRVIFTGQKFERKVFAK